VLGSSGIVGEEKDEAEESTFDTPLETTETEVGLDAKGDAAMDEGAVEPVAAVESEENESERDEADAKEAADGLGRLGPKSGSKEK
jgi:hypothetical protein